MSFIEGLLIFFAILFSYFIIVIILHKKGILEKYNISLYGPFLMIRTKKGLGFLKRIASKKRFWKGYGTWGIIICLSLMLIFTIFFIYNFTLLFSLTTEQKEVLPGPEIALIYPGLNPALPIESLGYFMIAIIIAMVVHEFSHGILTIIGKMKVKSLGLLYMILPVGAFCEPDEKKLKEADTVKRMRVYAAGPLSNLTVAVVLLLIFTFVFMPAVHHVEGVDVFYSFQDSPADEIELSTGYVITEINDTRVKNVTSFTEVLSDTRPNQTINITYFTKGDYITKETTLASWYDYTKNESHKNLSFLGISFNPYTYQLNYVKNPFSNDFPFSFLYLYILPLSGYLLGYNPIAEPFTYAYEIQGPMSFISPDMFWIIVNALFWIFWLNFLLALFNILPMIPLDGGYLFKDAVSLTVKKIKKDISKDRNENISRNISLAVSLLILFIIISQFFVKYI